MSQIAFTTIAATQAALIRSLVLLAAVPVIASDGHQHPEIEEALRQGGVAIEVFPPINAGITSQSGSRQAGNQLHMWLENVVQLKINHRRNNAGDGDQIDVQDALVQILQAVLGYQAKNGESLWTVDPQSTFGLTSIDAGTWTYDIAFRKSIVITPRSS